MKTKTTHTTAGPWHVLGSILTQDNAAPTGYRRIVATDTGADHLDILAANAPVCDNVRTLGDARLIAAAPALLAACKEALANLGPCTAEHGGGVCLVLRPGACERCKCRLSLRKAIAQAEGGTT